MKVTTKFLAILLIVGSAMSQEVKNVGEISGYGIASPSPLATPKATDDEVVRLIGGTRAKPMGVLPEGWTVRPSTDTSTSIIVPLDKLPNGKSGKFTVKPYELVPNSGYALHEPVMIRQGFAAGCDSRGGAHRVCGATRAVNARLSWLVERMKGELDAARRVVATSTPTPAPKTPKSRN